MRDPIKYSEADLKAKVMYLNLVEDLFYNLFEQIKNTK